MSVLTIIVTNATNLQNTDKFGKSDPYTIIEFQGQTKKTKVIDSNLDPQWNETLTFDLAGVALTPSDMLVIKVMDKEKIGPDKLMGTADVPLHDLVSGKPELKLSLNLMDKNKRPTTGSLNLTIQYEGPKKAAGDSGTSAAEGRTASVAEEEEGFDEVDTGGPGGDPSAGPSGGPSTRKKRTGKRGGHKIYSTKAQDFQVRVKVVEARQLQGANLFPVCKVTCKEEVKQTKVMPSTNSPFWNASFFFNFHISASDLFDEIITFEVFNSQKFRSKALVGSFKFDLSMVYEEPKHTFINKWLLLTDPAETNSGSKGYLKICTSILGPGDEAPNFSSAAVPDESDDIESNMIRPAGVQLRPAIFVLKVYQAEDLPIMDSAALLGIKNLFTGQATKDLADPYFVLSFAGKQVKTTTKYSCVHPEWNEELKMGLQFPSMCDRLKLQLFDWDRIGKDDAIGTLYLDLSSLGSMKDENGYLPCFGPCFLNFYGGPREYSDLPDKFDRLNTGKGEGIAYRGRVLVELTTTFNETSQAPEPLTTINSDQILRVSKYLRRRKYRLHTIFMGANMIKDTDDQIEFEVSIGNYGNKLDSTVPASSSYTQPTNAVFDGSHYYFLPWGDTKPCCIVESHWEDISCRLFSINYFLRIYDRLSKNIDKIKVAVSANIPDEEQAQFVISALDDLIMGCSKPLPTWEIGQSPETELDKNLRVVRENELDQIKKECMSIRESATSISSVLLSLEGYLVQLKNLSAEPQNSLPDVMISLICGGKRKHYLRIPAHDIIWSNDEDYRGRFSGKLQNQAMKSPTFAEEKDIKNLMIPCQLRLRLWLGLEKDEKAWHKMQTAGKLTVMAETYENQANLLGKWTTKSPMMTRPPFSDASGKIKLPKDKINPPPGWAWDGDWFVNPESSLLIDKNAMLTEFLEDVYVCEMRVPGGNWGPAGTPHTDVKGDPIQGPNEIVLAEGWQWTTDWKVDFNRPCDEEGWEYAVESSRGGFQPVEKMFHMSRRRRYVRHRKLVAPKAVKAKGTKGVSGEEQQWEFAPLFDFKFHATEKKLDMVRRRRWHRKMIATQPGAPCFFKLGDEGTEDEATKTSMTAPRMYLKFDKPHKWQLRAYIYQARDLLAADQNGFSDPYARVIFINQSQRTETQEKSICPTWDQTLVFKEIEIFDDPATINETPPKIVIELFDYDIIGEDEFIGRCEVFPMVKMQANDPRRAVLQWFPIFRGPNPGGEILAAFELYYIGTEELPFLPSKRGNLYVIPDGIRPMMQRTGFEALMWGIRNMKKFQLLQVTSPSVELEIGGNIIQSSVIKNVRKSPNFIDPFGFIDIMLPKEELYMPPINVNVRDHRAFGRKPIVGTICIKATDQYRRLPLKDMQDSLEDFPDLEEEYVHIPEVVPEKKAPEISVHNIEALFKKKIKSDLENKEEEDLDWWTKYYASHGQVEKCQKYLDMGYDKMILHRKELEASENYNDFDDFCTTFDLYRGKNDECDEDDPQDSVGQFKGAFRIYPLPEDTNEPMPLKYLEAGLPSSANVDCLIRVYVIKAYDLQPGDINGLADPYIIVCLGKEKQTSKEEFIPNSLTPEFGRMFEMKAQIPIVKDLCIKIMDYDYFSKDDIIGETVIDLENRYLTKYRALCGLPESYCTSGINQWRDSQTPWTILTDYCVKNRLPSPEFNDIDNILSIGHKSIRLDQIIKASDDQNHSLGSAKERLALYVLRKLPLVKEHIEIRSLYNTLQPGIEQGKLEMWVDIFPTSMGPPGPPFIVKPRKGKKFELRIVVKNTYDVILDETNLMGEKMSDIYVKGWIKGVDEKQETDVHYRSLNGEGNFNWRFVFPFEYIPSENCMVVNKKEHFYSLDTKEERMPCTLILQVWDNDLFKPDDFLGTIEMDLTGLPAPVKSKKSCSVEQLAQCGGTETVNLFETKRSMGMWPVYNNQSGKPELTGKLELEIELLPESDAVARPAGRSRDDPNQNPHLEPPNRPATSFFWFTSPWKTFKFIIWKNMKYYLITGLVIILLVLLAVLFVYAVPGLLAKKMIGV